MTSLFSFFKGYLSFHLTITQYNTKIYLQIFFFQFDTYNFLNFEFVKIFINRFYIFCRRFSIQCTSTSPVFISFELTTFSSFHIQRSGRTSLKKRNSSQSLLTRTRRCVFVCRIIHYLLTPGAGPSRLSQNKKITS